MSLLENDQIRVDSLPPHAQWALPIMVEPWRDMKAGRPQKHASVRTVTPIQYSIVRDLPPSGSDDICPDKLINLVREHGEGLLRSGYIAVVPVGLTGAWTFRRTVSGDLLWEVLERAG